MASLSTISGHMILPKACGDPYRADVGQTCIDGLWGVAKFMRVGLEDNLWEKLDTQSPYGNFFLPALPSDSRLERGRGQGCDGEWKRYKRPPFRAREGARVWWWVEKWGKPLRLAFIAEGGCRVAVVGGCGT